MDIKERSDSMTGTMTIIETLIPKPGTGDRVKCSPMRSFRKNLLGETDMGLQYQSIKFSLLGSRLTQTHGSGTIGGSSLTLNAGIHQ